uniref:Tetratricopeptide repeat protein n=1 Tax=Fundidesulfovibrio putealis TaxID=270496 RepID=A0A7C4AGZ9_9BACT
MTVTLSPMDQAALSAVPKSLDAPAAGKGQQAPAQTPDQGQPGQQPGQAGNASQTPPGDQPPAKPAEQGADPAKPGEPAEKDTLDDKTFMIGGEQAFAKGDFERALRVARTLLEKPEISKEMRESALYLQAEALFALRKDSIPEHFLELSDAIQQALNYNTTSWRLPRALIKLGYINLRQGNLPEARAYFNLLRNKYPLDEEVPLIDVHWGDYYMDQARERDAKANFERAAQSYREVLQKYPESRFARDAALGLSRTQLELNQFAEAAKIIDYIDKRWPRYYIENPAMRRVSADVAYKLGDFAKAKDDYLWYYNLVPGDASNDLVLARLGDVNSKLGKREPAKEFYDMAIRMFPGKDGALMSMMRLAEQGIHDAPTLQEMFKAFEDPSDIRPDKIYEIIANDHPKSVLAPLALAKLTMWRLYKQQYPETMDLALRFTKAYPGDDMEKQVVEAGCQAFGKVFPQLLDQMDYKRILELWNKYPFLAANANLLADRERLGVALALYYQGRPREALAMAEPYLNKGSSPDSQKALALMLAIYRENQDWQAILAALRKVASWRMDDGPRRALDFAQAMALEHTGDHARSRLLWARLAQDQHLDPAKRAYAVYYQGRTAFERGDYGKALVWGQDARTLFRESAKDDGKARDALLLMIEANQAAGRYAEALAQCAEFAAEAPPESAEWGANQLRIATLHRLSGDVDSWRKVLEALRDNQGESLAGRMAASELAASALEQRAGSLNAPK